ncbi:MAG: DMT family transporter [Gemmobacter sp.]
MTTTARASGTLVAAAAIVGYAALVTYADNFVRVIAEQAGLWQFHAMRSAMAFGALLIVGPFLGLRLRPRNPRAFAARSAVHGGALLVYFGCLGFLSVAEAVAGLFTAPIFVLLISRFVYGQRLGPLRVGAALAGFAGVVIVLFPDGAIAPNPAAPVAVLAGALYAMGNIATRAWCPEESAATLLAGFFGALGIAGIAGLGVRALWPPAAVPEGAAGFILRGWTAPNAEVLFWTAVQAGASLIGVGLMVKAYQLAEASRVAVFEYMLLPAAAAWTWVIWGTAVTPVAALGMAIIIAAGALMALRADPARP